MPHWAYWEKAGLSCLTSLTQKRRRLGAWALTTLGRGTSAA